MSEEVDTPTDQPDPKAIVGGAFSAAAETDDQVVGFFALLGRALLTAADPDRSAKVLLAAKMVAQLNAELTTVPWSRTRLEAPGSGVRGRGRDGTISKGLVNLFA